MPALRDPTTAAVASLVLGAWFALVTLVAAWTRPRRVHASPGTLELPGDQTPAVVNLITHRWQLKRSAVAATLIDLAARRDVDLEERDNGLFVRTRAGRDNIDLRPHERLVLEHVRSRTSGGIVPVGALTTGPASIADGWWRRFRGAVVDLARADGLSRRRCPRCVLVALGVGAVIVAMFVSGAVSANFTIHRGGRTSDPGPLAFFGALIPLAGSLAVLEGERETRAGRAAAARWLGYARVLRDDPVLCASSPTAVAVWDRHLAYGAAVGALRHAAERLGFDSESWRWAWSPFGGRWRRVRIRRPWRPGWGRRPTSMAARCGLAITAIGGGLLWAQRLDPLEPAPREAGVHEPLAAGLRVALVVLGAYFASRLVLALADRLSDRAVEGLVLRVDWIERADRSPGARAVGAWLAVDDGRKDTVRAWRVQPRVVDGLAPGDLVHARVSAILGHVYALRLMEAGDGRANVGVTASGRETTHV